MKKLKISGLVTLLIMFVFISNNTYSQWQVDSKYKFKINIPADWSKNTSIDGTDKIYDYYSADQNAAIQLRVFEAGGAVTTDMLAQAYEQSYLPPGTQKQSLENHTSKNGIPGKQGSYILNYNGTEVVMGNFYTVQNNIGYVLTVIIPSSMLEQKGPEVRQITQSFIIDGFEKTLVLKRETEKPKKGLSGLLGGTNNNQQNNSGFGSNSSSGIANGYNNINRDDVAGRYNFSHRSDGKNMTNYHYIIINKNGTYVEKYNPKNSGNYVGGNEGTWKLNGDVLSLQINNTSIVDTYKVKKSFISRTSEDGTVFTFKK